MYKLIYHRRAVKQLARFPLRDRTKVMRKLAQLKADPLNKVLHIKRYHGLKSSWRIRIGGVRVIYQVEHTLKQIQIIAIGHRGDVYK